MYRPIIGVSLIYLVTAVLMLNCGVFSLGTFPSLPILSLLGTALIVTAFAWGIYSVIGVAVCVPLKVLRPGFALPTVLGTVSGAAAISLTGWLFPSVVISHGWLSAVPFAFANTLAVWAVAVGTGFVKTPTFLPVRR